MSQDYTKRLLTHVDTLEKVNDQLLVSLKNCMEVMTELKDLVPDPDGWQVMLDRFEEIIKIGERVVVDRTLH
ncbi:MAG: hypothetical protein MUP26_04450 [Desulfobulbaceae bacterium]|nr:hypothetical protein [Desulfobulbaceae bacterium]